MGRPVQFVVRVKRSRETQLVVQDFLVSKRLHNQNLGHKACKLSCFRYLLLSGVRDGLPPFQCSSLDLASLCQSARRASSQATLKGTPLGGTSCQFSPLRP